MSSKVVSAWSNKETGVSKVTIQNKYGRFTGFSFCNEEDFDTYSEFVGQRYAEIRANLEFAKLRYRQEKIKLRTVENLYKDLTQDPLCEHDKSLRYVKIKLRDYAQSVSDWENLYKYLEASVKEQDKKREEILKRTRKENN